MLYARVLAVATRGVRYASLENDPQELILTMTDGHTLNLGRVQGRGIDHVEVLSSGKLKFYYDDGSEPEIVGEDVYSALHALMVAAQEAATDAINAKNETIINANAAHGYARDANRAKTAAETAQGLAEAAQEAAETAQGKAEDAQGAAEDAQEAAEDAQEAAEAAQDAAEDAQEAAETAQGKAEDAQTAAEAAQTAAETAAATFETDKTLTVVDKAADAGVVGDVLEIKITGTAASADDFNQGRYTDSSGGNSSTTKFLRKAKNSAPILPGIIRIAAATNYYFSVIGWDSENNFLGYWHGANEFRTTTNPIVDYNYQRKTLDLAPLFVSAAKVTINVCHCTTATANADYPGCYKITEDTCSNIATSEASNITLYTMSDAIQTLREDLTELSDTVDHNALSTDLSASLDTVNGKYIKSDGDLAASANFKTLLMSADGVSKVYIKTYGTSGDVSAAVNAIAFYNDDEVSADCLISGVTILSGWKTYEASVPEGSVLIAFARRITNTDQDPFICIALKEQTDQLWNYNTPDPTLSITGAPADAAATGNAIKAVHDSVYTTTKTASAGSEWEQGRYLSTSMSRKSTDVAIRLKYSGDGIPQSVTSVKAADGYKFKLYCRDEADEYLGEWTGSGYVKKGNTRYLYEADLGAIRDAGAAVIKACLWHDDITASISPSDGVNFIYVTTTNNIDAKLDANLGTSKAGKILTVAPNGSVTEKDESFVFPGASLLRKEIPEQYTDVPEIPESFDDDAYIDERILAVPENPTFIFSTDEHFDKINTTRYPDYDWRDMDAHHIFSLLAYVRNRLGVRPVMFGGDLIDGAPTKYEAKLSASAYTARMLAEFGGNYLLVQGNHDSNIIDRESYTEEVMQARYFPPSALWKYEADHRLPAVYPNFDERIDAITQDETERAELKDYFRLTYYIDYPESKTRFIVVNTGSERSANTTESFDIHYPYYLLGAANYSEAYLALDFVYHAIYDTPEGYNIVVAGHWFLSYGVDEETHEETVGLLGAANALSKMLTARKMKTSDGSARVIPVDRLQDVDLTLFKPWAYSSGDPFWPTNHNSGIFGNIDFSNAGDVGTVMMICGHNHRDKILVHKSDNSETVYDPETSDPIDQTNGDVPCICTQCENWIATLNFPETHEMTVGTTTDQCFDVVTVASDKIVLTRFGAGNDRTITISNS